MPGTTRPDGAYRLPGHSLEEVARTDTMDLDRLRSSKSSLLVLGEGFSGVPARVLATRTFLPELCRFVLQRYTAGQAHDRSVQSQKTDLLVRLFTAMIAY